MWSAPGLVIAARMMREGGIAAQRVAVLQSGNIVPEGTCSKIELVLQSRASGIGRPQDCGNVLPSPPNTAARRAKPTAKVLKENTRIDCSANGRFRTLTRRIQRQLSGRPVGPRDHIEVNIEVEVCTDEIVAAIIQRTISLGVY